MAHPAHANSAVAAARASEGLHDGATAEALGRIAGLIAADVDLAVALQQIVDEVTSLCRAQHGAFVGELAGQDGVRQPARFTAGAPGQALSRLLTGADAPTRVAVTGLIRSDDVTRDARFGADAPPPDAPDGEAPVRSYLAAPVVSRTGEVLGGLFLGHVEPAAFTVRDERLLATVASLAAATIETARLVRSARRAEAAHARRAREAALGAEIGAALTRTRALPAMLQQCAEACVRGLDAGFVRIWTLDEPAQTLVLQASAGAYTHLDGAHARVPLGAFKIGRIAQERAPHLTNDVLHDPRIGDPAWARREGYVAFAGYPLVLGDRLLGVLALFARAPLGAETLDVLASVAGLIALGIDQRRVEQARAELLAGEQTARAEVEAQRAVLRATLLEAPAAIAVLRGPDLVFELANPLYLTLVGRRDLVGRKAREALPEVAQQGIWDLVDRVRETGEPFNGSEFPALLDRRGDGTLDQGYFDFTVQRLPGDGVQPDGVLIFGMEVTAQVQARQAIRASEARYRSMTEAAADIIWSMPPSGEFQTEQPGWSAFTGQTFAQLAGSGWLDAVHPDDRAQTAAAWSRAVASCTLYEVEHRLRRSDGEYRHMAVRAVPVRDDEGRVREWIGVHRDVHEQRRLEAALAYQNKLNRTITDNATLALFLMDDRQHCTFMNPAAVAMTGFTVEEVRDRPLHDIIHYLHPDGRPYPIDDCPIDRALPQRSQEQGRDVFIRKDGTFFPVAFTASPILEDGRPVGTVIEVRDITDEERAARERERVTQALREREERLRAALFASGTGTFQWDMRTGALEWDEELDRLFGLPPGQTARSLENFLAMVHPDDRAAVVRCCELSATEGADFDLDFRVVWPDGAVRWLSDKGKAFRDETGRPAYMTGACVDITARKHAERERERLIAALERSNRDLDQFAYVASHDLKAPLRGIANLSQWIEEDLADKMTPDTREQMELLRGRVWRLEGLIDGILRYSRAARVLDKVEAVDVGRLLGEVVELLAPRPGAVVAVAPGMPELWSERVPLQQVFMNLIGNALKYTTRPDARVEVTARELVAHWEFAVTDNGPGIAPEFHERIWGIFQTLESRDRVEGTGIGLSVVKRIVESRGGRVWVESAEGQGATFHFTWLKRAAV